MNMTCENNNFNYSIISLHGREAMKDCRQLERSRLKIARGMETLTFMNRCRSTGTIPNFAKINHHLNNRNNDIFTCASLDLIGREIKHNMKRL